MSSENRTSIHWLLYLLLAVAMIGISAAVCWLGMPIGIGIACLPLLILMMLLIVKNPFYGFLLLFFVNYFMTTFFRYSYMTGLSVVVDIVLLFVFASVCVNLIFLKTSSNNSLNENLNNKSAYQFKGASVLNLFILSGLIWAFYCILELLNPSAMVSAWVNSRGVIFYPLLFSLVVFLTVKEYRNINTIIMILSVFTLLGVGKALIQKNVGFDAAEQFFLNTGGAKTHLLSTGTRYFSIYASAGIFGPIMGFAVVLYGILAIYTRNNYKRLYFIVVALAAFYGMVISGTRGALAVPIAGAILFIILSKRTKTMFVAGVILCLGYVFLTMTYIGQGNALIRRMRTAFDTQEPSLVVRKQNQEHFAEYLQDKPFGEGLGLSGVDAQETSLRFTTSIPTDSWYVKIWVETGAVGVCLHIAILAFIMIYGSYIILFKIKNTELRGTLIAFLCGAFGIIASSYGNQVIGQYPITLIVYMGMSFVFMGQYFDKQLENRSCITEIERDEIVKV